MKKMPSQFPAETFITAVDSFIESITSGIENYGIVNHPKWGKVYAYRSRWLWRIIFVDDANIPSHIVCWVWILDDDDEICRTLNDSYKD